MSAITQAELLRGVAKKPEATQLSVAVNEFLIRVDILPWGSEAVTAYAQLRTNCKREELSVGAMDMLIAAHAVASDAILVTNDQAFYRVSHHLKLEHFISVGNIRSAADKRNLDD